MFVRNLIRILGFFLQAPHIFSASPETFLATLDAYISEHIGDLNDLEGFMLVAGPGSATALRATHSLVNALAFAKQVSVFSIVKDASVDDVDVFDHGRVRAVRVALPVYAHEARITHGTKDALRRSL